MRRLWRAVQRWRDERQNREFWSPARRERQRQWQREHRRSG